MRNPPGYGSNIWDDRAIFNHEQSKLRVNDGHWSLYIDLRCLFKILFKMKYLGTDWLGSEGRNRHRTGALAKATAVV